MYNRCGMLRQCIIELLENLTVEHARMYHRCQKTPDTASDADLDPPPTPFSLYQPFISNPPPLHFGSNTLQFISTTLLQLSTYISIIYIKSSFPKIKRLHFYLSENSTIHSLQMFWVVALIEHTDINQGAAQPPEY